MNLLKIDIAGDRREFRPGEVLNGTAEWSLMEESGDGTVHLLWHTEGIGTKDAEIVESVTIRGNQRSGRGAFQFTIPKEPYSYSGKLVSIVWEVELVVERCDDIAREKITVRPDAESGTESGKEYKAEDFF